MEESAFTDLKSKKTHPRFRANIISKYLLIWGFPLLLKGYRRHLTEDDLYKPIPEHESRKLGDRLEKKWAVELNRNKKNPSLLRVLLQIYWKDFIYTGILEFTLQSLVRVSQPLVLGLFLNYYVPNQTNVSLEEAYLYAFLIILAGSLFMLISNANMLYLASLALSIRISCGSLIYRKALKLNKNSMGEHSVGQIINLLANDTRRFDYLMAHIHSLWIAPVTTLIIMYLLYINFGITSLAGMLILIVFIPLQVFLSKRATKYRMGTAVKTDERIKIMNEIVAGIQIIKMYTWEKPFAFLVEQTRKQEVNHIRSMSFVRVIVLTSALILNKCSVLLCVLTYVLVEKYITAQYVFVVIGYYSILRGILGMQIPQTLTHLAETKVSLRRIKKYLLAEELIDLESKEKQQQEHYDKLGICVYKRTGVHVENATAKWKSAPENTLTNINFTAYPCELVAIVGGVGSGKSSLLQVILGELPLSNGTADIVGRVSYAPQEPWIFAGSIRQNILFGEPMDVKRYQEVIKVCALSHDLQNFPYGDQSLVGEKGVQLSGGQKARINLARAVYRQAEVYLLDDPLSAVDSHVGRQLFNECIAGFLKDNCVVLITHQIQYLKEANKIYILENGEFVASGTFNDLQNNGCNFMKFLQNEAGDETKEQKKKLSLIPAENEEHESKNGLADKPKIAKEHMEKGKVNIRVYKRYFEAGGHPCWLMFIGSMFLLAVAALSGSDYFLTFWVNLEQDRTTSTESTVNDHNFTTNSTSTESFTERFFTTENCIYLYTAMVGSIVVFNLTRSMSFYAFCMEASKKIHENMFTRLLRAPMRFFNTNNTGRILNRFSKDMGSVDEILPHAFLSTLLTSLDCFAAISLIMSVNLWILIPTIFLLGIIYFSRTVYIASSRNLKRMEGTTKSPVFGHLSATLQGLTTIRAFRAQKILQNEFDCHQDLNSSAYYMFTTCNRTFGFWLDFNNIIYTSIVILSYLLFKTETYGGNVGLAITQATQLKRFLQQLVRESSELENQMTAVERVLEYTDLESEPDNPVLVPPKLWPELGEIEFRSVSLRYSPTSPYVLNKVSFKVQPKEKVGIVGRTGAGKTSLLAALFRLTEMEGQILIDSIDSQKVSLENLRSRMSVIPQEPVLFSGTLRKNLDPFEEYSDSDLWNALEQVELKNVVADLPSGLHNKMSEGGSNFSVGQRQLLCLARAVIRHNRVLILDEATANVDPQTDELIQKTIRTRFSECTVLTVAHRLLTVMDSDKILVMHDGHVVEFDHPHVLLQNHNGFLFKLVKQTGATMANHLTRIADLSFWAKQ